MKKRTIILIIILLATIGGTCGLSANPIQTAADTTVSAEYLRKIEQDNRRMNDSIRMLNIERQLAEYVEKKAEENRNYSLEIFGACMTLITCAIGFLGIFIPWKSNDKLRKKLDETAEKSEKAVGEITDLKTTIQEYSEQANDSAQEAQKSANEAKALTYFMQALKEDDWDQQIELYTKSIKFGPTYAPVYNNRGTVYGIMDEYDKAIEDFSKAIEINPKYAEAYYNRGLTYHKKGELDKAIANYTKAIEINPDYAEAYYNRGLTYHKKGELDKAIKDFTKAIEKRKDYAKAYNNRGNAYDDKGEYDKSIADYTEAIKIDPNYAAAYGNRGVAKRNLAKKLEAEGKTEEALAHYKAAVKDFSQFLKLWTEDDEHREIAIRNKQECEEAIKRLEGKQE